MGILKRSADLVYTYRFLRLLVMEFQNTEAYKLGIIDASGKRDRSVRLNSSEKKDAYTPFMRMAFNLKRLLAKVPGGSSKLATFASALYLIKEHNSLSEKSLEMIVEECGLEALDFLQEDNEWFITENRMLSPGVYRLRGEKMLNTTGEMLGNPGDKVRIRENSYPVGNMFGIDVYEGIHERTRQSVYLTTGEIIK